MDKSLDCRNFLLNLFIEATCVAVNYTLSSSTLPCEKLPRNKGSKMAESRKSLIQRNKSVHSMQTRRLLRQRRKCILTRNSLKFYCTLLLGCTSIHQFDRRCIHFPFLLLLFVCAGVRVRYHNSRGSLLLPSVHPSLFSRGSTKGEITKDFLLLLGASRAAERYIYNLTT